MMKYSFYTLIAYDYRYAYGSILSYYNIADEIILAIDKERISWSGKKYEFNENQFYNKISEIDKEKKIKIIEDNFHKASNPLENDTNERNFISEKCKYDYIIGIDSDEILLNPEEFLEWLNNTKLETDINTIWYTVYKSFGDKILITLPYETAVIGTNIKNCYKKCRITNLPNIDSPLKILHYSWGRSREDVIQKIENWSHSHEFNSKKYLNTWDDVTLENYKSKKYLHPLNLKQWWINLELKNLNEFKLKEELRKEINENIHF